MALILSYPLENSPDYAHFNVVHKSLPIPFFGRFLKIEFFDFEMSFDPDPAKKHIHYFHNKANMWVGSKKLDHYPPQESNLVFEGPGVIVFHVCCFGFSRLTDDQLNTPFGRAELFKNIIPIAPFHIYNEGQSAAED